MVSTAKLAELADLADIKGWRLALVGDPQQFTAVGRGGMFGQLVDVFGAIELDRVHRFDQEWEREASLLLRRGDPRAAERYADHGRLHHGTATQMERASVKRWWEQRQAGHKTLLMTPTNEATERLNQRAQQLRIRAGEIDPAGRHVAAGRYEIHVGDEIATRHNDRQLRTDRGEMVKNRAVWTVDAIHRDGSLTATGNSGVTRLPSTYVTHHVDLAYARTDMAAQGRNVTSGTLYLDRATDVRNLYVAMTRGTASNEAFIVTNGEETALDVFTRCITTDWIDRPAHARRDELNGRPPHRPGLLDNNELRTLLDRRVEITTTLDRAERDLRQLPHEVQQTGQRRVEIEITIRNKTAEHGAARGVLDRYDRWGAPRFPDSGWRGAYAASGLAW